MKRLRACSITPSARGPPPGTGELVDAVAMTADAKPAAARGDLSHSTSTRCHVVPRPALAGLPGRRERPRGSLRARHVRAAAAAGRVSTTGGEEPHWSPDGRRSCTYRNETQLMAVARWTREATFTPAHTDGCCSTACYNLAVRHRHQLCRRTQGRPVPHGPPHRREHGRFHHDPWSRTGSPSSGALPLQRLDDRVLLVAL